jgi:hypothetical protein
MIALQLFDHFWMALDVVRWKIRSCRPSRPLRYSPPPTVNTLTQTPDESENQRLNGAVLRQHNRRLFAVLRFGSVQDFVFGHVEHRTRSQRRSLASASSDDEDASKLVGHRIGEDPTTQSADPSSDSPDRPQSRRQPAAGRRRLGAAVAARNCKSVLVRGKAQWSRCRHSSAERIRTRTQASSTLSQ